VGVDQPRHQHTVLQAFHRHAGVGSDESRRLTYVCNPPVAVHQHRLIPEDRIIVGHRDKIVSMQDELAHG
jgi:hypothetical protein